MLFLKWHEYTGEDPELSHLSLGDLNQWFGSWGSWWKKKNKTATDFGNHYLDLCFLLQVLLFCCGIRPKRSQIASKWARTIPYWLLRAHCRRGGTWDPENQSQGSEMYEEVIQKTWPLVDLWAKTQRKGGNQKLLPSPPHPWKECSVRSSSHSGRFFPRMQPLESNVLLRPSKGSAWGPNTSKAFIWTSKILAEGYGDLLGLQVLWQASYVSPLAYRACQPATGVACLLLLSRLALPEWCRFQILPVKLWVCKRTGFCLWFSFMW